MFMTLDKRRLSHKRFKLKSYKRFINLAFIFKISAWQKV